MKKDINSREDIVLLVDQFYRKVKQDDVIGYIFNEVTEFSWDVHIPIMVSFWETILLHKVSYKGNPVLTHVELNRKSPLEKIHFDRWRQLFFETLDEHFDGAVAEEAKKKVEVMEALMLYKISESNKPGFIQ